MDKPFVAIYEPFRQANKSSIKSIKSMDGFDGSDSGVGIIVESEYLNNYLKNRIEYIMSSRNSDTERTFEDIVFKGTYGVICKQADKISYLYLGNGKKISEAGYMLESPADISANLSISNSDIYYSAGDAVTIKFEYINSCASEKYEKLKLRCLVTANLSSRVMSATGMGIRAEPPPEMRQRQRSCGDRDSTSSTIRRVPSTPACVGSFTPAGRAPCK